MEIVVVAAVWMALHVALCERTLLFSALVFRHGERERHSSGNSTEKCYKHLLSHGRRQMYILGRVFRSRYILDRDFLPQSYDPFTIYFRSTHLARTIDSALCFFSGLYKPNIFHPSSPSKLSKVKLPIKHNVTFAEWKPFAVPIRMWGYKEDKTMNSYKASVCPTLKVLKKHKWGSDRKKDLAEEKGTEGKHYVKLANTPDLIKVSNHNILHELVELMQWTLMRRSVGGEVSAEEELLARILKHDRGFTEYLKLRKANPRASPLKLAVFSGHDTVLVALLNGLGVRFGKQVPVASVVSIELLMDSTNNNLYVDVKYNMERLALPRCKGLCTFKQFTRLIKKHGSFPSEDVYASKCSKSL